MNSSSVQTQGDNIQLTHDILAQVLNVNEPENSVRKANESLFEKWKTIPGFSPLLLEIACNINKKYSKEIELNSAIQLKNFILSNWKFNDDKAYNNSLIFDDEQAIIIISKEDKKYIRDNIIDAVIYAVEIENVKILKQINQSVKKILMFDFRKIWYEQYTQKIVACFTSNNQKKVYAGIILLHQLSKIYEYEDDAEQNLYNTVLTQINAYLLNFLGECTDINQPIQAQFVYKIVKIFFKSFQGAIPQIFLDMAIFGKWSNYILSYIQTPITASENMESGINIFWKLKRVSYQTITRICQKFTNIDSKKMKNDFKDALLTTFAPQYWSIMKVIYSSTDNHGTWIDSQCKNYMYNFFADMVNKKKLAGEVISIFTTSNAMKEELIKDAIMPKGELDLYFNEPKAYISKQLEEINSWFTKRYSANKVLNSMMNYTPPGAKKKKTTPPPFFNEFYGYWINTMQINAVLQENENKVIQESQANKIGYTYSSIKHNWIKESLWYLWQMNNNMILKYSPETVEQIINNYILPELASPVGLLREKACNFIAKFKEYQFTNQTLVNTLTMNLCGLLEKDPDLPVRINSAIAAVAMISQPNTRSILQGNIKTWLSIYLKLMEETDIEEIIEGWQVIIKEFKDETKDFIIQWCDYLIKYFNKIVAREADEDKISDNCTWINNIITTFSDIIQYFINNQEIYQQIEKYVDSIWDYCLGNDAYDKIEDALDIWTNILKTCNHLPKHIWKYFVPIIYTVTGTEEDWQEFQSKFKDQIYEGYGYESISEISRVITYFIVKDPETFWLGNDIEGRNYLANTMQLVRKIIMICESKSEFEDIKHAIDILLVIFNSWQGKIDIILNEILEFIVKKSEKDNQSYKTFLRMLLSSCFIYSSSLCLNYFEKTNQIEKIFKFWFEGLDKWSGKRNIKYNLMGLCCLIVIDPACQNKWIIQNMKHIIGQIIKWTDKSYELVQSNAKQGDKDDEYEEDDEDEDEEGCSNNKFYQKMWAQNLDDFVDDDISFGNDDDEVELTDVDKKSDILFLRDTLTHVSLKYSEYYNNIVGLIGGDIAKLRKMFENEQFRLESKGKDNNVGDSINK